MRLKQTVKILIPALGLTFALGVQAADDSATRTTPAARSAATQAQSGDIRASTLIGKEVQNAQGKELGEITDLIVDTSNGRVQYAIVSYGGFLGLGDKQYAQPLSSFKMEPGKDKLVLNIDEARLKEAPGFEKDRWPEWNQADYRNRVDRYWGSSAATDAKANPRYVRASKMLDADVELANGDDVGDIEDMVVNLKDGKIRYVVLDFDRAWSLNDKLVALPPTAFRAKDDGEDLILKNSDREQLRAAPAFDKNRYPTSGDRDFYTKLERWENTYDRDRNSASPGAEGRPPAATTQGSGADSRSR